MSNARKATTRKVGGKTEDKAKGREGQTSQQAMRVSRRCHGRPPLNTSGWLRATCGETQTTNQVYIHGMLNGQPMLREIPQRGGGPPPSQSEEPIGKSWPICIGPKCAQIGRSCRPACGIDPKSILRVVSENCWRNFAQLPSGGPVAGESVVQAPTRSDAVASDRCHAELAHGAFGRAIHLFASLGQRGGTRAPRTNVQETPALGVLGPLLET